MQHIAYRLTAGYEIHYLHATQWELFAGAGLARQCSEEIQTVTGSPQALHPGAWPEERLEETNAELALGREAKETIEAFCHNLLHRSVESSK